MRKPLKNIIIAVVLLVLVATSITIWNSYQMAHRGSVAIHLNPSDTTGVTVAFNGKTMPVQKLYTLHNGSYDLSVTRTGFKPFSTSFMLRGRQALIIDVRLELASTPVITSASQLSIPGLPAGQVHLVSIQYFENNLWAVVRIALPGTDPANMIVQYDPVKQGWQTRLGPGTSFNESDTAAFPTSVSAYLKQQGLFRRGGSQ